ncbi:MAG TPA: leucine-rich repeat domain-containing protein [Clostridia bacterium]|nr:leucine-rich repeat domain-containing protein [Clostridia bacterium]
MPKKIKMFITGLILALVGIACVALFAGKARAEDGDYAQSGDGWSISADGVMKIESDQGWVNCLKVGFKDTVWKLIIGRDVTNFRIYKLPYDLPTKDFFGPQDIIDRDRFGNIYYEDHGFSGLFPSEIVVEEGNPVFIVVNGLLINTQANELVLSEMKVTNVAVPEGVQTITCRAFYKRNLTSIQFPESLREIDEDAFSDCSSLASVDLPDSIQEIKAGTFSDCISLGKVSLSDGLERIGKSAFEGCAIQSIEIPQTVNEIGAKAFSRCEQMKQVVLHAGLTKIEEFAFRGCSELIEINFPEGIKSIGEQAFNGCYNLNQVFLPDSLQQVGNRIFDGCKISLFRIPEKLAFTVFYRDRGYIVNAHKKTDKSFELSSVETVILSGSDYDFGYPAISHAHNVYFLGKPPEDVGQILDENSVENIFCSDEFEFEWTRSTVASWVRQRLTILPAEQIKDFAETAINTTPEPTNTPRPTLTLTPKPTETPWPTPMPRPTTTPITEVSEQKPADPILFVFAGVLALVVAGIAVVAMKSGKTKRHPQKKGK